MTIAVLGLGEAGARYASDLAAAGAAVRGFDPYVSAEDPAVAQADTAADAVSGAAIVISFVGASAAVAVAESVFEHVTGGTVYADFNTASPRLKSELAERAAAEAVPFADVAVLAPVPRAGHRTPLLVSGTGADRLRELFTPFGAPVEVVDGPAGAAAGRKLIRSVFMKGLAGVVLEAVAAGDAADCQGWIRDQMVTELSGGIPALLDRLQTGSRMHAVRRAHEVADARTYLRELGTPEWMTDGAHAWLCRLADETASAAATPQTAP